MCCCALSHETPRWVGAQRRIAGTVRGLCSGQVVGTLAGSRADPKGSQVRVPMRRSRRREVAERQSQGRCAGGALQGSGGTTVRWSRHVCAAGASAAGLGSRISWVGGGRTRLATDGRVRRRTSTRLGAARAQRGRPAPPTLASRPEASSERFHGTVDCCLAK